MEEWTDRDEAKLRDLVRGRLIKESRPRRDLILSGAREFMSWFMDVCSDIYNIIKSWVVDIWEWLFG